MEKMSITGWGKFILIVVLIIAIGVFAVNQIFNWYYKSEFLLSPCELCEELNPHLKPCFYYKSSYDIGAPTINISNISFDLNPNDVLRQGEPYFDLG